MFVQYHTFCFIFFSRVFSSLV